ncbi:MAG: redox-sensing transcriptional repressor Rex [Candidatus Fermentibacteraceae bacterium]|nr:redox-sensing transcriptional repressor Rex [Candidatus Fermentibacteraceae bacterium]MBN2608588.1 redox-sensing transcriptional repressor Rex [Candidatus Fermentibacteraceae bacterium]
MAVRKVSEKTIRRLSHYAMCLRRARNDGVKVITSSFLSGRCGISAAAVRKDLAAFGDFGKQGSGYRVDGLLRNVELILGTCDPPPVIVVGVGNIGRALLESGLDGTGGYRYTAAFDADPDLSGEMIAGVRVLPLDEIGSSAGNITDTIAIVAVSAGHGQDAVDRLLKAGCRCILSFNLEPLEVPEGVSLRYVEVSTELDILTHSMKCGD